MKTFTLAMFGEAERGEFCKAEFCNSLSQLAELFGNPPKESLGLHFAVQALLYKRDLIFIRVREEGFSYQDYFFGLHLLEKEQHMKQIAAVCIPGVGDTEIIDAITPLCLANSALMIVTESDLYDYLTSLSHSS